MIELNRIKKNILFCCMLLSVSPLIAGDFQSSRFNQRFVSLNPGYVFSGNGDSWGFGNEVWHFKSFTPHLFHIERLQGWIVNGRSWIDGGFENQTGLSAAAEIGIAPFKTGNRIFYLSAGGILGYFSSISPDFGASFNFTYNGKTQSLVRVGYGAENYLTPGFTVSAGYITKVNSSIMLNIRAHFDVYQDDRISTLSIGIGLNTAPKH